MTFCRTRRASTESWSEQPSMSPSIILPRRCAPRAKIRRHHGAESLAQPEGGIARGRKTAAAPCGVDRRTRRMAADQHRFRIHQDSKADSAASQILFLEAVQDQAAWPMRLVPGGGMVG